MVLPALQISSGLRGAMLVVHQGGVVTNEKRRKRAEEYAQGLFNSLSKDRYLTDHELAMIADRMISFAAEVEQEVFAECAKACREMTKEIVCPDECAEAIECLASEKKHG